MQIQCEHQFHLNTGAGLSLFSKTLFYSQWNSRIKRSNIICLRTTTPEPLYMGVTVLLHINLGDLCVRVWFGIDDSLVVEMILGTSLIDRLTREIFPAERRVVPWYFYPMTIHVTMPRGKRITSNALSILVPTDNRYKHTNNTKTYKIRVARQTLHEAHIENRVRVTITTSRINTVNPKLFRRTRQTKSAAQGVVDIIPSHQFLILVSSFSTKAIHLPNDMVVAYTTSLPMSAMTAPSTHPHCSTIRTSESVDQSTFSDLNSAYCEETNFHAHGKELQATKNIDE